jgi:hypothetical protein
VCVVRIGGGTAPLLFRACCNGIDGCGMLQAKDFLLKSRYCIPECAIRTLEICDLLGCYAASCGASVPMPLNTPGRSSLQHRGGGLTLRHAVPAHARHLPFTSKYKNSCFTPFKWARGLRRGFAAERLLGSWVRIPGGT